MTVTTKNLVCSVLLRCAAILGVFAGLDVLDRITPEPATIVRPAFADGGAPLGPVYDFDRVYDDADDSRVYLGRLISEIAPAEVSAQGCALPDAVLDTLRRAVSAYPWPVLQDHDHLGEILVYAASQHAAIGVGLSRKTGGTHVQSPVGPIAEDILMYRDGRYCDVFVGAAPGRPIHVGIGGAGVITDPSRGHVDPVPYVPSWMREQPGPSPTPTPTPSPSTAPPPAQTVDIAPLLAELAEIRGQLAVLRAQIADHDATAHRLVDQAIKRAFGLAADDNGHVSPGIAQETADRVVDAIWDKNNRDRLKVRVVFP